MDEAEVTPKPPLPPKKLTSKARKPPSPAKPSAKVYAQPVTTNGRKTPSKRVPRDTVKASPSRRTPTHAALLPIGT